MMKKFYKTIIAAILLLFAIQSGYSKRANIEEKIKEFNGVQVIYTDLITEEEVDNLGAYFIASEFADGGEKMAMLTKKEDAYQLYIIVRGDVMEDEETIAILKGYKEELCAAVFSDKMVDLYYSDFEMQPLLWFPAKENPNDKPRFIIVNETGYDIHHIYVSRQDSDNWEEDLLGDNILENEEVFIVSLLRPLSEGNRYDILLVDKDGDSYSKLNVLITNNMFIYFVVDDMDTE